MKKLCILIFLLFLIISLSGCIPASKPDPTHIPIDSSKETGKIYRNEHYDFTFEYPVGVTIQVYESPFEVRVSTETSAPFSISATRDYLPGDVLYFLDTAPSEPRIFGSNTWQTYELPDGYCDGPECSSSILALQMEVGQVLYKVVFYDQLSMTPLQEQILSTFQILP